jgi:hypothetical protein
MLREPAESPSKRIYLLRFKACIWVCLTSEKSTVGIELTSAVIS